VDKLVLPAQAFVMADMPPRGTTRLNLARASGRRHCRIAFV